MRLHNMCAAYHVEQRAQGLPQRSSLIVCPPTLVGHWPHEIAKFLGPDLLSILQVVALPLLGAAATRL